MEQAEWRTNSLYCDLGCTRCESWPVHLLPWPRVFMVLLRPSNQLPGECKLRPTYSSSSNEISGLWNVKKLKKNALLNFNAEMKAQEDEGGGRILLGYNNRAASSCSSLATFLDPMSRNVGKELPLRCVIAQKIAVLIYLAVETSSRP